MALLLGLDLHNSFDVVFVLEVGASSPQGLHACLHADCLQHGSVEIFGGSGCVNQKVPSSTKLISLWFIFLEWILRICTLASSLGRGNSIFLSSRPDLIKAGSSTSGLLVAQITLISSLGENLHKDILYPSRWLSNSNMVLWTSLSPDLSLSNLLVPIASISSMKMIVGAFSLAMAKASLTILGPSPMYIWTKFEPANFKNVALVWPAQALAIMVLPVPGGPNIRHPLGGRIPIFLNLSL